jgi:Starch-binding associating with outer membrane
MKRVIILFSAIAGLALTSCKKDFLDVNQNPNTAVESNITPDLVLPSALSNTATRMGGTTWGFAKRWMGYWSRSGTFSANSQEESYNIAQTFSQGIWSGTYDNLYDYHFMQQKAEALNQKFYVGIAKIMKAHGFQTLVDVYGNIPYSTAFDVKNNIKPAYDNAQTVYNELLKLIDAGIADIKAADINANPRIAVADVMFKGNKTLWAKFGNTLKLRLLMHQSQVAGFNPAAEIARITAEGSGFLGSLQDAAVNPGYASDRPNPFWTNYAFTLVGQIAQNYDRANNYALNEMKNLNDIRHQYFYKPRVNPPANTFAGVNYGEPPLTTTSAENTSDIGGALTPTGAPRGLAKSPTMAQWILTSVESFFLQAEAIQRGWLPGSAQSAYQEAVRESFRWLLVPSPDATADAFMAGGGPKRTWADAPDKLALIAYQKYTALNGIDGEEAWTEVRRSNIIVPLSFSPSRTSTILPVRLLYPQTEYDYNASNVGAQGSVSQFTSKLFWDN